MKPQLVSDKVTENDILDAIRQAVARQPDPEGAVTVAALYGTLQVAGAPMSKNRMRERIRVLIDRGALEVVRVQSERIDGIVTAVPAYRLRR